VNGRTDIGQRLLVEKGKPLRGFSGLQAQAIVEGGPMRWES